MDTVNGHQGDTPVAAPTATNQSTNTAKTVHPQSAAKRLQSELMAVTMSKYPWVSAFPEENIFFWKGTIQGSKDTVFEGIEYKLSLSFPSEYPFKPPKVKFETMCFHPNVDLFGNICLDILGDQWSSAYDVEAILISIQSLLGDPNISDPINIRAAKMWSNQQGYRKVVEEVYKHPTPIDRFSRFS